MDYRTVAEGKKLPGLRLALSMGVPGPWGESAKSIFHAKGIPFTAIGQHIGEPNPDLVAWTGVRNAPVAVFEDEKPVDRWLDILMLAERIKPMPALLPASSDDRAMVVGLANEICGEWGFGWCRRAMLVGVTQTSANPNPSADKLKGQYKCDADAIQDSPARCAAILRMLVKRLKAQQAAGSPFLVGSALTAVDIYWACFSALLEPMPADLNPMPAAMRELYGAGSPETDAAKDPILIAHRDYIYKNYLKLPLDF